MGCTGFVLLAVAVAGTADGFDPFAVATPVAAYDFGPDQDRDYDRLPDGWTRRTGPAFPGYVEIEIDAREGRRSAGSLRVTPDGAPAVLYSPPIRIDEGHLYVFEGLIRTQRLHGDAAVCSVSVLDGQMRRIARHLTVPVSGSHRDWARVRVGPIEPVPGQTFVVLGCHLVRGAKPDLAGAAWFDDLRFGRLPVVTLDGRDARFRRPAEPTTLVITALGLEPEARYRLSLSLRDVTGAELDRAERDLVIPAAGPEPQPHVTPWPVPGAQQGYYRFEAELRRDGRAVARRETTFVVTDPGPPVADNPFGWCVAELPAEMGPGEFALACAEGGAGRVKLPLWRDAADRVAANRASEFVERLAERQIATVGLLDPPPDELRRKFASSWAGTGEIYRLRSTTWAPSLDAVIARHGARVRFWQLGRDGDGSFADVPDLAATLTAVRGQFGRVGRDTQVGIPWPADRPAPPLTNGFVSLLQGDPGQLAGLNERPTATWVTVRPAAIADIPARAADLVQRVVLARAAGAAAVFTDAADPQTGLLRPDGAPTELFLPWRTTAVCLRDADYLGPLSLTGGSRNRVFAGRDGATVAIWNDEPTAEVLTPGGAPVLVDVWGRPTPLKPDPATGRCELTVGPSPVFLTGASSELLRWQMTAGFDHATLQSRHGAQSLAIVGTNPFGQGVSGSVTLTVPRGWKVEVNTWPLRLAAGEAFRLPVILTLPADASLGPHPVELAFDIQADRPYRFTLRKDLTVGVGDIDIEVTENRLPDGRLEVIQTLTNRTSPTEMLNFRCDLFVPGAQRQRQYVVKLGPGHDTKRYYLPDADALRGKELWLRAEQENGRRVLNYRWTVGKDW